MIFNNKEVTDALAAWKSTKDKQHLTKIFDGSKKLIEAIVSQYDSMYRDDMIQAVNAKLLVGMEKFNPNYGTPLHTYFTTIIHNMCRTVMKTESRHFNVFDIDDMEHTLEHTDATELIDTTELIVYCRNRFPNIDSNLVDYVIAAFINYLDVYGAKSPKLLIAKLARETKIDSKMLEFMYKISIIILRYTYMEDVVFSVDETTGVVETKTVPSQFLPELIHIFGEDAANQLQVIFKGMTLRF